MTDSKTSFTPGPWEYGPDVKGRQRVFSGAHEIVRALSTHGTRRLLIAEREANAHLIAAAPDLWKSVMIDAAFHTLGYTEKAIKHLVEAGIEEADWIANNHSATAMANWARETRVQALAKARGTDT